MSRVRNVATADDLRKVLLGSMPGGPDLAQAAVADLEEVAEKFEGLLCDILKCTPRPTARALREAAQKAWSMDHGSADLLAGRLISAISFCRTKSRSMTSGKKTNPAVHRISECLSPTSSSLGKSLMERARSAIHADSHDDDRAIVARTGASSSSPSFGSEVSRLRDLYGMPSGASSSSHGPPTATIANTVEVISSQEVDLPSPPRKKKCIEHFDSSLLAVVRDYSDGTREIASMRPGPNAFALAQFAGEPERETECPNLLLSMPPPTKRPAAAPKPVVRKRPAAGTDVGDAAPPAEDPNSDEEPSGTAPAPTVEAGSGSGDRAVTTRRLLYSKVYHKTRQALGDTVSVEEAKLQAQRAAQRAVAEARAAGCLVAD